ncbi:MAG: bifunctional (p)ppGpp synthetase/guanosine-3',5'-bis(diphosphate) 3'-pyrophosphohydrolase [bacterium]|nr:bifunctional (p)ppGpp synthetase/guanosine-3',5'-bis(diphosphate) 3'-pyrophosphohydrolase [bacterium]
MISFDDLKVKLEEYLSNDEIKEIERAYLYAEKEHDGQYRKTGEPYIVHPLFVASILTTIRADKETIIAGLLHDTIEDTDASKSEIKDLFGETVANLVDGVTKINNINVSTENEHLTNYYKKIIVGMSEDVRVIIIKLADRLHNMRTLYALGHEKQKKKAKETLEILAPIAHRLGMHKIKSELEDLSLKYLKPEAYKDVVEKLNHTKFERELYVKKMMEDVSSLLRQNGIKHQIKGRAKSIYSIYKKLDKGRSFNDIYDLLAIRILVEKEQECYLALGLIHSKYKPISKRFKDFIAMPKTNLYQTLHTTVFGLEGNLFEIQIRTYDMDEIAENGIASHWAYKEKKNAAVEMQNITEQKLQFYKSIIELKGDNLTSEDFIDKVKNEVLNNNIYVYTPKGDVIEMPIGSTPIDFAYRIHSQVGDKMTGAIVNNSMVNLSYELKNGDIIKIITNNNSKGPSREWLGICKTTGARNKIKGFFNRTSKDDYIEQGKDLLEKELRRRKIPINSFMDKENLDKIFKNFKLESIEDIYLNIGNNKYSAKQIVKKEKEKEVVVKKKAVIKSSDSDILVGDNENIETHIANCCLPVPGDEIVGYITKANGISIHRKDCSNIEVFDDRILEASWNKTISSKYKSEIIIHTNVKESIILLIAQIASQLDINIENINLISKGDANVYSVTMQVQNLEVLNKCINNLSNAREISDVERIIK